MDIDEMKKDIKTRFDNMSDEEFQEIMLIAGFKLYDGTEDTFKSRWNKFISKILCSWLGHNFKEKDGYSHTYFKCKRCTLQFMDREKGMKLNLKIWK